MCKEGKENSKEKVADELMCYGLADGIRSTASVH